MDRIHLRGLEVYAHHGVFEFEQTEGQRFVVDVTLHIDLARAGRSDDLEDTVDYGAMAESVHACVAGERHQLIERVAERVAEVALAYPLVAAVDVRVHKPEAPIPITFSDVVVDIHRSR